MPPIVNHWYTPWISSQPLSAPAAGSESPPPATAKLVRTTQLRSLQPVAAARVRPSYIVLIRKVENICMTSRVL